MDLAGYRVPSIWSLVGQRNQIAIIEFLTLQNLALGRDARCEVHFHIQGALNKLYKADTDSGTVLMRVSPSVDSRHMSEATTIELARKKHRRQSRRSLRLTSRIMMTLVWNGCLWG